MGNFHQLSNPGEEDSVALILSQGRSVKPPGQHGPLQWGDHVLQVCLLHLNLSGWQPWRPGEPAGPRSGAELSTEYQAAALPSPWGRPQNPCSPSTPPAGVTWTYREPAWPRGGPSAGPGAFLIPSGP